MALFIDVARGNPAVAERRAWLEPFWAADGFDAYIARGLLAEHALWHGDTEHRAGRGPGHDRRTTTSRRGASRRPSSGRPRSP